jgi:hypothetical protein
LALPTEQDGFIVCARATVLAVPASVNDAQPWRWPEGTRSNPKAQAKPDAENLGFIVYDLAGH